MNQMPKIKNDLMPLRIKEFISVWSTKPPMLNRTHSP